MKKSILTSRFLVEKFFMTLYFTATSGWYISKRETRHVINQVTTQQQKLFGNGHMHPSSLHAFLDSFQALLWQLMMASQKVMFLLISYETDKSIFLLRQTTKSIDLS